MSSPIPTLLFFWAQAMDMLENRKAGRDEACSSLHYSLSCGGITGLRLAQESFSSCASFEEASYKTYSYKEINSVSKLREFGNGSFPSQNL